MTVFMMMMWKKKLFGMKRMYKTQRNYENVQRALFNGVGCYEIPMIEPTQFDNAEFIGLNYAKMACSSWLFAFRKFRKVT